MVVRIGTRNSKLALWQTQQVSDQLTQAGFTCHIVHINTEGDLNREVALYKAGSSGLFTKAIDRAMLDRNIDIAVHSAKDIPSRIPDELDILAFLRREDPREVLLAREAEVQLENYSREWVIGTSSLRRKALLKHYFHHVTVKDIRGNIDTRIQKLKDGQYDGIMLAYAGVKRMGWDSMVTQKFNLHAMVPAVGQGAIAVVGHGNYEYKTQVRDALNHITTEVAVTCERAFLRTMDGGCHTPVFGLATVTRDQITLTAGIASVDGAALIKEQVDGAVEDHINLGNNLALTVLDQVKKNRIKVHE